MRFEFNKFYFWNKWINLNPTLRNLTSPSPEKSSNGLNPWNPKRRWNWWLKPVRSRQTPKWCKLTLNRSDTNQNRKENFQLTMAHRQWKPPKLCVKTRTMAIIKLRSTWMGFWRMSMKPPSIPRHKMIRRRSNLMKIHRQLNMKTSRTPTQLTKELTQSKTTQMKTVWSPVQPRTRKLTVHPILSK